MTESNAAPIYQTMETSDDHNGMTKDLWMDVPQAVYEDLRHRDGIRSRIVYGSKPLIPDDAQGSLEPVLLQYRFQDDDGKWTGWMSCGKDHYDLVIRDGQIGPCKAEGRALYAAQPPAAPVETCKHEAIINLDGKWHCQKCAAAIQMTTAHNSPAQCSAATSEAGDPIRWIKDTYLMWLKGDLDPVHMRLGQHFFRDQPQQSCDIVERLRWLCSPDAECLSDYQRINNMVTLGHAAADEIERLRAVPEKSAGSEGEPFMMLSCREAKQCLHNIPGCICDGDPTNG